MRTMDYDKIVQDVIEKYKDSPIDMLGINDAEGELRYISLHKYSYIRTVRDIDNLWEDRSRDRSILEIGSFLGPVSISLKNMGYSVCALDIPEFYKSSSLRSLYEENDIPFTGLNLRKCKLPYESNYFDAIILCEVIEHLNFNPLPVLMEINRVLKKDGYIYIGTPNQPQFIKRLKLLFGKSINDSIDDFFKQLDRNDNMIVGLHWREYTLTEIIRMIEKMGFKTTRKYYFTEKGNMRKNRIKAIIKSIIYMIPSFREYQVVIGQKVFEPTYDFWLTEANS